MVLNTGQHCTQDEEQRGLCKITNNIIAFEEGLGYYGRRGGGKCRREAFHDIKKQMRIRVFQASNANVV